jgi:type II secretory pathway pseudopilin PulG
VSRRTRWWHVLDEEAGLGLIEVMLAIFVLGIALLALASIGTTSLISLRVTRDREQATNSASAAIEAARARDYGALAMAHGYSADLNGIPEAALPPGSDVACVGGEPVAVDGAVADPVPFVQQAGNGNRITVHTLVTYEGGTCGGSATDLKRVIAIASWTDQGTVRFVRQETLVASANRGLPVPRFDLRPPESSLGVSKAFLTDTSLSDKRRCVEHQLRNLGAEDSYDWAVDAADGYTPSYVGANTFRAGDWFVTAYLHNPALETNDAEPPSDGAMSDAGGLPRPASDERIEPGETASVTVCYEPAIAITGSDPWPAPVETTIAIRSRFDDRQLKSVMHNVAVRDEAAVGPGGIEGTPYYLFDYKDYEAHPRTQTVRQGNTDVQMLLPLQMGPLAASPSPDLVNTLGTISYSDTSRSNWSTDVEVAVPGLQLRPATDLPLTPPTNRTLDGTTVAWHRQFPARTVLLPDATLVVWAAPRVAAPGVAPSTGVPHTLEVHVDGLKNNESTIAWTGKSWTFNYTHTVAGWQELVIPLDFGAEVDFGRNEYLRLRVTCASTNTQDCNLAYDNTQFPSALYVQVK